MLPALLIRYLGLFERTLKYNNGGQGFFIGDKVTDCMALVLYTTYNVHYYMVSCMQLTWEHVCKVCTAQIVERQAHNISA